MRRLDGITHSTDMNLHKLREIWRTGEPGMLQSMGLQRIRHNLATSAAAAKLLQSCPTLCDPIDGSPPGFPIPGILQARTLEWVAFSFSNAWKWKVKVKLLSRVWLPETPWTAAYQAPSSMGFSRQEYWSGVPLPSPFSNWTTHKYIWFLTQWYLCTHAKCSYGKVTMF